MGQTILDRLMSCTYLTHRYIFWYNMYIMKEKVMTIQEICLKLNEENISKLAKYTGAEGVSMKEYALALLENQS